MNELNNYIFPKAINKFFNDLKTASQSDKRAIQRHHREWKRENLKEKSFIWVLSKSGLPWLRLDVKPPWEEMLKEARRLRPLYVAHRQDPKDKKAYAGVGWKTLTIHGLDPFKTMSFNNYGYKSEEDTPYHWTTISKLCPVTTAYFKKVYPCKKYYRLRFSLLEPGGYILPHTDRGGSALWEVNFALSHPKGCYFKMKGQGYVPQKPKSAYILDVFHPHAVINTSNEDRFHIIVHGNPAREKPYQDVILRSYRKVIA